ncbi:MAG: hypothetical protein ACJ0HH_00210 [Candidatus Thalassarchaeum sp.]
MDDDIKKGLVLIGLALVMFPVTMDLMQQHDDVVKEHERECDIEYRLLVLDTIESPDPVLCAELEVEKSSRVVYFIGSIALFMISGVCGLVLVLPHDESGPRQPPMDGQLR